MGAVRLGVCWGVVGTNPCVVVHFDTTHALKQTLEQNASLVHVPSGNKYWKFNGEPSEKVL